MNTIGSVDQRRYFLATALATRREQHVAVTLAVIAFLVFCVVVPFVRVPLARMPAFIPSYEAALFFIDLITAVLLFDQFVRLRSFAVLALASGYLFDALIIVPHALSFPGAFAPGGLLGAGPQTTAWLYVFWHGGFPLFVMAYAWLRWREDAGLLPAAEHPTRAIAMASGCIVVLAICFASLATVGHDVLPVVMEGSNYSLLVTKGISPAVWILTLIAMLMLWPRRARVVDLWVLLVMWIWLFDIALSAIIGSQRFDLGFYAGRIFGLIAASFLLITLLVELIRLYTDALGAAAEAERRLTDLVNLREQGPSAKSPTRENPKSFIARQNIARYRELLKNERLDDAQRRSIERLLAEEEALQKE